MSAGKFVKGVALFLVGAGIALALYRLRLYGPAKGGLFEYTVLGVSYISGFAGLGFIVSAFIPNE